MQLRSSVRRASCGFVFLLILFGAPPAARTASPRVMWSVGFPGVTSDGVRFRNCNFRGLEAPE